MNSQNTQSTQNAQNAQITQSKPTTTVFNLIILDESGSMSSMFNATVNGCNETLSLIRANASPDIKSLVSIYAFQSDGPIKSRYIIKNAKPEEVKDITVRDYSPCGLTPLFDAVGSTLTELKAVSETHDDATGIITIITDGYENASKQYTGQDVTKLISQFKEMGWTVNLIGANINVEDFSRRMNIDNWMSFKSNEEDAKEMFGSFNESTKRRYEMYREEACMPSVASRVASRKSKSKGFFSKD